jgi:hypothetical protein
VYKVPDPEVVVSSVVVPLLFPCVTFPTVRLATAPLEGEAVPKFQAIVELAVLPGVEAAPTFNVWLVVFPVKLAVPATVAVIAVTPGATSVMLPVLASTAATAVLELV